MYTAAGIFATLVLSLTFVPAVIVLVKLRGRDLGKSVLARALSAMSGWARQERTAVLVGWSQWRWLERCWSVGWEARMDNAAFFSAGSPTRPGAAIHARQIRRLVVHPNTSRR